MPYLIFLLICTMWGSSFILMKKASLAFSHLEIGAGRVIGGAVILGILYWWRANHQPLRKADLPLLAFIIVIGFAWPYTVQPYLVALHGSAFIGMTVSFVPLMTILVSVPILGVYPSLRQLIGVLGALICLGFLMVDGIDRKIPPGDLCLAATVPLTYSITNACISRWLRHMPSLQLTLFCLVGSSLVLLPLSLVTHSPVPASQQEMLLAVASLILLGVASTGMGNFLFNKLLQEHGPLFAGMVTNLVPVGAVMWGWFDEERVTPLQCVALAGILSMVALVQYGAARRVPETNAALAKVE
jgi:drug/metabolite transporter (DMT)-like permease